MVQDLLSECALDLVTVATSVVAMHQAIHSGIVFSFFRNLADVLGYIIQCALPI
jgi:hypothetical protein